MRKKYNAAFKKVEPRDYKLDAAVSLLKEVAFAKFDESVDLAVRLGVDPKHSDQMVRGSIVLPHGTGKTFRVLVFAKGEKVREAESEGADFVGGDDIATKVQGGWLEFDRVIATPDMMGTVGKLGKVLGPRGLMPNPKTGTVTFDVARAIQEIRRGKVDYKVDRAGIIHAAIGKVSFSAAQVVENVLAVMDSILRAKPASAKGKYIKTVSISSTMGPAIRLDSVALESSAES